MTTGEKTSEYRRKVYTNMYHSSMSQIQSDSEKLCKRIIPTTKIGGVREEFKKIFLPLLIDIFELRQKISSFKTKSPFKAPLKSPEDILHRLVMMQKEIEEAQKWCDGVILQISKGIEEAKEALQFIGNSTEIKRDVAPEKTKEKRGLWLRWFKSRQKS